jgi:hypothetical protein
METLVIRDIIPGRAADNTLTPGRRFLQVVFRFAAEEGYLVTKRTTSRNFWDSYKGQREDGADLNIQADQLYLSICEACGITAENIDSIDWNSKEPFQKVIGMKVKGDVVSRYVEEYRIPGSLSALNTRFTYSTVVLEGEDENNVFRTNGHVIIQDPKRLEEIKRRLEEISSFNEQAREERQAARGVPTTNEREGTGAIIAERSLEGHKPEETKGPNSTGHHDASKKGDDDKKGDHKDSHKKEGAHA